jgi:hypothetical protein
MKVACRSFDLIVTGGSCVTSAPPSLTQPEERATLAAVADGSAP